MGLSSSKAKTRTFSSGSTTTAPQVPSWISQPYQNFMGQVSQWGQQAPSIIGPSALQQQAFSSAGKLSGDPSENVARWLRDYQNPWEDEVVSRSLADRQEFYQRQIAGGQSEATQARAYGGSRHGVADSLLGASALRGAGDLAAQLRAAGFNTALTSGMAGDASTRANIGLLGDLGGIERGISQENDPHNAQGLQLAQLMSLLAGSNPELFAGQQIDQTGQSTTETPTGGWLAQLGGLFQGMGDMGISFGGGKG